MGRKKLLPNRADIILDAAAQLFSARSYEKTTLEEIAAHAGVSKGSIYLEFASKEQILHGLIQRNKTVELADMRRIVAKQPGAALELLKTMLVQNMCAIYDSVQQKQLSLEQLQQTRKHLYPSLKPFIEARLALIEELLARAEKAGEIKPLPARQRTAQLIMMALRDVRPPYREETTRATIQQEAAEMIDLLIDGLR